MDDEALGLGGVIAKHVDHNHSVRVVFIANRIYNHKFDKKKNELQERHALKAKKILGYDEAVFLRLSDERIDTEIQNVIMKLEEQVEAFQPETVYISFRGDNNQDHRAVFDAARVVLRPAATPFIQNVFMYEIPSSTEQSPPLPENVFIPNCYVDIHDYFGTKIKAIECYETEKRYFPHPRSIEAVEILAKKRGIEVGFFHAEAFMLLRQKWAMK